MSKRSPITKDEVLELWAHIVDIRRRSTAGDSIAAEWHMNETRKLLAAHCKEWGQG